jgi:DNA-binding MarR family transcriptional regulator
MADQRPIGFWLKLVDRLIDEQFAATLEEHGVTRRQWQLLNVLAQHPATVEQLNASVAPFLDADDTETALDHLTELIESAWVDATPNAYELTDRGRGALERLSSVVAEQRTIMSAGVTETEYITTVSSLETMARNLGWGKDDT